MDRPIIGAVLAYLAALAAGLALLMLMPWPVQAASPGHGCKSVESVVSTATERGHRVTMLTGDPVARAVAVYNAVPPASHIEATTAVLVDLGQGGGIIMLGSGVDLCVVAYVKAEGWESVKAIIITGAVLGERA